MIDSDCPKDGQHYECNTNKCECIPGFYSSCIGMLPIQYPFNVISSCKKLKHLNYTYTFSFLLGCTKALDCPDEGQHFLCNSNFCECEAGFYFNGDSCADGGTVAAFN